MSSIDLEFTPLNFVKTCLLLRISDGYEEKDKKGQFITWEGWVTKFR